MKQLILANNMKQLTRANNNIRPTAILFDLDGTLIDSAADLAAAVNGMLQHFSLGKVTNHQVSTWIGNGAAKLVERTLATIEKDVAQDRNIPEQQALAQFFVEYEQVQGQYSNLYKGVKRTLEELKALGFKLALITNKPKQFTPTVLSSHGIDHYFDLVLSGDSLEEKKPHPLPILHALQKLEVTPQQAVMVGDSASDITAAAKAGVNSICVTYGYNHGEDPLNLNANLHIDNLTELLN